MTDGWKTKTAGQVAVGDRVRLRGVEITVARVDGQFLGRPGMIAFIEDTPERWLKVPTPGDAEVEVRPG
ncbi:MAG TPA: hypothetical protein VHW47_02300 [Acidimicrobiales bacterium]|jgi:hypothetical protein|nr:hypothetical protein [Acidimicrobiales bacterium]